MRVNDSVFHSHIVSGWDSAKKGVISIEFSPFDGIITTWPKHLGNGAFEHTLPKPDQAGAVKIVTGFSGNTCTILAYKEDGSVAYKYELRKKN